MRESPIKIGDKVGRLTVTEYLGKELMYGSKKRIWKCVCDCGKEIRVPTMRISKANTKSCGCLHSEKSRENSLKSRIKLAKPDTGFLITYGHYRRSAYKRGLEFSLSTNEAKILFASSCHYCGCEPSQRLNKMYPFHYNGIDRLDNDSGYIPSNCVPCCYRCNHAKHTMSYSDFLTWISKAYKHISERLLREIENAKS